MKIDIVGLKHRGTAMGLNESAGYVAVGLSSAFAAYYAETSGLIAPILYTAMGIVLVASTHLQGGELNDDIWHFGLESFVVQQPKIGRDQNHKVFFLNQRNEGIWTGLK